MMNRSFLLSLCIGLAVFGGVLSSKAQTPKDRVDFDRDVRPILAETCFACHGFDANKRQANLRLDTPEGAMQRLASGKVPVAPGNLKASAVWERITRQDALKMPPAGSGKKISEKQIATLRRWILQGGKYDAHWAFVTPKRPALPVTKNTTWARTPIDRFLLARLEQEGLKPSPEADPISLIRRVTLDLTGLPPTQTEVNAFLADKSANAYEKVVERLLASPRYGERMALHWLDLSRYADTHGYHIDSHRDMWRWRDWVIAAFNRNLPYDRFLQEQLAGDLLPNPTLDQRIATGFNRNHPINFEGGAIPEEYQTAYVIDRIDTTATAILGLTMRCAQCHDHKYDPISMKDFYRFYAYFNNIEEQGLDGTQGNAVPYLKAPLPEQEQESRTLQQRVTELEPQLKARAAEATPALAAWLKDATAQRERLGAAPMGLIAQYGFDERQGSETRDTLGKQPNALLRGNPAWDEGKFGGALRFDGSQYVELGKAIAWEQTDKFSYGAWVYLTANEHVTVLSRLDDYKGFRGWDLYVGDRRAYVHLIHEWEKNAIRVNTKQQLEMNRWHHLFATYDGSGKAKGVRLYLDGKPAELDVTHDTLNGSIRADVPVVVGRRTPGAPFKGRIDDVRFYSRELPAAEVAQLASTETIRELLALPETRRTPEQQTTLTQYFLENVDSPYKQLKTELDGIRRRQGELDRAIPTTMVMKDLEKSRETFMLVRGQYDKRGEKVPPGTPEFLPSLPKNAPATRLALAQWITRSDHPLTPRVAVNHFWQVCFGVGLVKTSEDFGTQGERPSHPELLDWLATEFVRSGWDVKAMMRLLVTSAAYRQTSKTTPTLRERDPENRLLARAPRYRLPAEFIRDQALAVSGLLVRKIGGPSVRPYHPKGLWEEMAFGGGFSAQSYVQDHGDDLYRRTMYTFWKRTVPPPSLLTLDAPEREFCVVRRSVTNTPLQALVLMNDPTYVEAARKFAERIMTEGGLSSYPRLQFAYREVLGRNPKQAELNILMAIYNRQAVRFQRDPVAAKELLSVGESPRNTQINLVDHAAWTAVASVLLNLDETLTKG